VGKGWGGKKLLNLIDEAIFTEGEERLLAYSNPNRLDTGTHAAHIPFMRELYRERMG
jgi:hypothetical protein